MKTYTIKPLAQVYQEEGLPAMKPPPAGETRAVRAAAVSRFVESLRQPPVVAKKAREQA